jgi:phosphopantothenoylcysteine synthetase/decarboxylase
MIANKKIVIIGGGTMMHVKNHLALCAPAYGSTANTIMKLCHELIPKMDTELHLTKMAGGAWLETNDDISGLLDEVVNDYSVKIVFMNAALCDFSGQIEDTESGKYTGRLKTADGEVNMVLRPTDKLLGKIRKHRKDIFLVAFKTTCGASEDEQYQAGLRLLKTNSCNLVLANDTKTRVNMIIAPEEARYHVTTDRYEVLRQLVDMAKLRSHLTFTKSTVVGATQFLGSLI